VERALRVLAWGLLASMLVTALHDVSMAWDVWYYHLPFAARLWGIVPASQFVYDPLNQARFEGFPLLGEVLQGLLWRVTGYVQAANLVALASVPLFAWLAKRRLGVPMYQAILALLAVPLVQIHATSCYVDLPGNAAMGALVLLAIAAWADEEPPSDRVVWLALACAAVAANTKALLHPVVGVALVAIGWRVRRPRTLALAALALPLVFFTPLKNLLLHHNPYYPVDFRLLGLHMPGVDTPYSSSPVWLEHAPRPVRFFCSVLEIGVRPMSDPRRWTVDQWTPPSAPGYRMGGFFGLWAAANLVLFVWLAVRGRKERRVRAAVLGFVVLTAIVSELPQSHELRYYMGWMMVLVVLNLWLLGERARRGAAVGAVCAIAAVVLVTRAAYVYPSGKTFDQLVASEVSPRSVRSVHDGEHVCVRHAPWNFLWAARFHAPKHYAVTEAVEPAECDGARSL
jgi:hypothetical protein